MKQFLAVYTGTPDNKAFKEWNTLSKDQRNQREQEGMKAWGQWMEKNAGSIIDAGGPLGKTLGVDKRGVYPTKNNICGYVTIKAESHEAAAKLFIDHPHFNIFPGEGVEIIKLTPIPGQ